jgi:hypothetical protein
MLRLNGKRLTFVSLFGWMCLATVGTSNAAEPLRWKFAVGDDLEFHVVQNMRLDMESASGALISNVRQEFDMTWHVAGVNDAGDAVIVGRFNRIQTSMENADEEKFSYDSANDEVPAGLAAMVSPMYEAMTAGEYEITMSARGEVRDVRVPEEVAAWIKKGPGADAVGEDAGIEAFKSMITQGIVPLPEEAPSAGQTWSTSTAVHVPNCESATVETTYRYDGTKVIDGTTYAVIRPTLKMALVGNDKLQTRVKEQQTSGEILFDPSAGRAHSIELEHRASIEVTVAGQTLQGMIDQRIDVAVAPKSD